MAGNTKFPLLHCVLVHGYLNSNKGPFISGEIFLGRLHIGCSLERDQALSIGVGVLTPRPQTTRELTLELILNSEKLHKRNHLNIDLESPNHQQCHCRKSHLNNNNKKMKIQSKSLADRITISLSLAYQRENKQTKTQHKSHPM